jgi:NADH-quinone oxidoreductase subunit N
MISTPVIWIVLPMFTAACLWFIRRHPVVVASLAVTVCLLLALLAWVMPFSGMVHAGPLLLEVSTTLTILGRRFVLAAGDRHVLVFLYLVGALWFLGEGVLRRNQAFVPFGLAFIALSISALAVDPFLYSALIIEIMALISIPMLLAPGSRVGHGVMRFLVFLTIGMALILLAGWAAGGVDLNPSDTQLITQALILLGLGFVFWTAVFPFHSWVPQLSAEVFPYQAGFLLNVLTIVILLMGLDYLNGFGWLRNFAGLGDVFRFTGVITAAAGGIWAAYERRLDRYMGFCLVAETGFSFLALSLQNEIGYRVLLASFLPRTLFIALWSLAMSTIKQDLPDIEHLAVVMKRKPVESITLLFCAFSMAGLPLLGFFPLRQALLENLAQNSLSAALGALLGIAGLMAGSLRILRAFITAPAGSMEAQEPAPSTDWRRIIMLVLSIIFLVLTGLFPQWFYPGMFNLLEAFTNLV